MTPNDRLGGDASFGRSTGDAAVRGALLVGVAVIIGALLLWRGHDDNTTAQATTGTATTTTTVAASGASGSGAASGATGKTGASGTSGATASTGTSGATATTGVHKPAEVKVLVANGTGSANGAGNVTAKLQPKAYAMLPAADASAANIAASRVYYRDGYAEDAKQVARDMGVAEPVEALLERMPDNLQLKGATATANAKTAHIVVIIGLDKKIAS
jgi:LytR cell envelope-related transcriptional attenuator